jgi:hypothetical protein
MSTARFDDGTAENITETTEWIPGRDFKATQEGVYAVSASYMGKQAAAKITVKKGEKQPLQADRRDMDPEMSALLNDVAADTRTVSTVARGEREMERENRIKSGQIDNGPSKREEMSMNMTPFDMLNNVMQTYQNSRQTILHEVSQSFNDRPLSECFAWLFIARSFNWQIYCLKLPLSTHSFFSSDHQSTAKPFHTYSYGSQP